MSRGMVLSFLAVIAAASADIIANIFLTKSNGFKQKGYGIAALVLVCLAFTFLSFAIRRMDLAVAYAMWGAFGILGTSLGGALFFGQRMKPIAWLGIGILVAGVVLMHLG